MSPRRGGAHTPFGMVVVLTSAAFLVFAQAFMIAPVLPRLAQVFGAGVGFTGLAVPAYLIPYGLASLVWGPIADRVGRRPVIVACLALLAVVAAATATTASALGFIGWRVAAGLVASGVVPVSLALIADVIPYEQRGRALGWVFGGMAGGMAAGSAVGALAEPVVGWQGLFLVVAVAGLLAVVMMLARIPHRPHSAEHLQMRAALRGYARLLANRRARRVYAYVALNAVLQSGIYTWLGLYLHRRFALGPTGIGLAVLGYGIPGFILGPSVGRAADRFGRARLLPAGVAATAVAAFVLATPVPLITVNLVVALLSLGYDLTQPLLAGIVTDLPGPPGQAVALMAVILFCGFGVGSLVFQALLPLGFTAALVIFGAAAVVATIVAVPAFSTERPH